MKKLALVMLVAVSAFCLAATAFAGSLAPGASMKCNGASSITMTASGTHPEDRGNANATMWKSSNFTTVPIALGPTEHQNFPTNGGGAHGNANDIKKGGTFSSAVNMSNKYSKGQKAVTLKGQSNFSRGDSIGDIGGEVRITNTGTVNIDVKC